jgi:2-polyprenyl-3-methyl-5-hydroxy-6-metoxy-1,4-benzoquinol methylase
MRDIACPSCGGSNVQVLSRGGDYLLVRCGGCTLTMKLIENLNRERVQDLQDSTYNDVYGRTRLKIHDRMARHRLEFLTRFVTSGELLEIGCATGEFLELAGDIGFDVLGVDTSRVFTAWASKKGLAVRHGRVEDINLDLSRFDVVAAFHLLEHIENPLDFLRRILSHLKPGGLFYITTPNVESLSNRVFGYRHPNFQQADHLFFYSETSLTYLLKRAGFNVLHISSNEYVHHLLTSLKGFLALQKVTSLNKSGGDVQSSEGPRYPDLQGPRKLAKRILSASPYVVGALLYPILRPYGLLVERWGRGHELVTVAQRPTGQACANPAG